MTLPAKREVSHSPSCYPDRILEDNKPLSFCGGHIMEKLKIGGLKQSLELSQFDMRGPDSSEKIVLGISKLLASKEINIEFLTYNSNRNSYHQLTFCINQDKFSNTSKILTQECPLPMGWEVNCREHVGIISIFPHHSGIEILAIVMLSWAEQSIPIRGISTSLSAISFVTDYHVIDKAVKVVQDLFQLPDNHAPIKPEILYYQSTVVKGD
jgi:aspartokinase